MLLFDRESEEGVMAAVGEGKVGLASEAQSPKCIFGSISEAGSNICKSATPLAAGANPLCPRCGSKKVWRDGRRSPMFGNPIQRWLCRDCALRFSDPNDTLKAKEAIETVEMIETKSLKSGHALLSKRQICVTETKNLVAEQQKTEVLRRNEADAKGSIVGFSFWLLKQGYSQATIKGRVKLLNRLMRLGADFNNEDSIKEIISKQIWSVSRKVNAVDAYDSLLKMQGKTWTPPIYRRVRKLPFIPTEAEIDQLIAGCSNKMATYLQMLKETGMRCGEACELLKWTDINLEQRSVRITPEKGSNPRILPLSIKLVDMLNEMPKNTPTVFSLNADLMRHNFEHQRKRISAKLKNSRINQITFHTFRHWKATMEYRKTRDILHVREILGHKSLNNTMIYTQLISFKDDDFSATVAHSEEEACKLIEAGFEYVCDFGQNKIFRKRK
jgi:integrase